MENTNENIGFLFDLDGVLIDSEPEYTRIWSEIDLAFPTGVENFAIKIKGQTLPEILNSFFDRDDHEAVISMLNDKEQKMRYEWLPGAIELLKRISDLNLKSVLVTSSNDLKMKHLHEERPELKSYFRQIVTADKIKKSKPDPEGYLLGAHLIGALPQRCVVFEDSLQGVKAGNSAKAYVVGLSTTLPKETIEPFCDKIVRNLKEIELDEIIGILKSR